MNDIEIELAKMEANEKKALAIISEINEQPWIGVLEDGSIGEWEVPQGLRIIDYREQRWGHSLTSWKSDGMFADVVGVGKYATFTRFCDFKEGDAILTNIAVGGLQLHKIIEIDVRNDPPDMFSARLEIMGQTREQ